MNLDEIIGDALCNKGIDTSAMAKDVGFTDPVYISKALWRELILQGDGDEYCRLLLIYREYLLQVRGQEGEVAFFDVAEDEEFCMLEPLKLVSITRDGEIFIRLDSNA